MRHFQLFSACAVLLTFACAAPATATTTSGPCNDGSGNHAIHDCANRTGNYTRLTPAGSPSTISKDVAEAKLCGRKNYFLAFANSVGSYSSGTLTFRVTSTTGLNVSSPLVRVLALNSSSCDDMRDFDQYSAQAGESTVNCNRWTDLGTLDVSTTGSKSFTIPNVNSVIGNSYTRFPLVDVSTFSSSTGLQSTNIATNVPTTSGDRPVLALN